MAFEITASLQSELPCTCVVAVTGRMNECGLSACCHSLQIDVCRQLLGHHDYRQSQLISAVFAQLERTQAILNRREEPVPVQPPPPLEQYSLELMQKVSGMWSVAMPAKLIHCKHGWQMKCWDLIHHAHTNLL